MADFEFGPAEFMLAQFDTDRPSESVFRSVGELVATGTIRVLDLLLVERHPDGSIDVIEMAESGDGIDIGDLHVEAAGIAGDEDVQEVAELLEPGTTGVIFVFEHVWAKELASRFFESGGTVLYSERIPAPVLNAVAAEAYEELETTDN
jgi:hypothetical protein